MTAQRTPAAARDPRVSPAQQADCLALGEARTARHPRTGAMRFIGTEAGRPILNPRPADAARSPEAAARAYLGVCGSLLGLKDQASELTLTADRPARNRRSVLRFQQRRGAVPVLGAELVVHVDGAGQVLTAGGETTVAGDIDTQPEVGPAAAAATGRLAVVAGAPSVNRREFLGPVHVKAQG